MQLLILKEGGWVRLTRNQNESHGASQKADKNILRRIASLGRQNKRGGPGFATNVLY